MLASLDPPAPAAQQDTALVRLTDVAKIFPATRRGAEAVTALRPTSVEFRTGEIVTIVGPSGCGKSTLLSLVAGLERPTSGRVEIGGKAVQGPYERTGIVFQKDLLLPWRTVLQNILLQAEVRGLNVKRYAARALDLLEIVGIRAFANHYPHELSGGMRQRVSICRALLHDPQLLLMDEPFAALDAITRDQLSIDFARFVQADNRTVVFITHNMDEAVFLGDRVMVMTARPGRIAETIEVDLPHPRHLAVRDTPAFIRHTARVRQLFMQHGILRDP